MFRSFFFAFVSLTTFVGVGTTAVVGTVGTVACDSFACQCFPCGRAIDLAVFDQDGNALADGWTVEATVDGFAVDLAECEPDFRFGSNACSFGDTTGIYRITLRGPDIQTREIAARAAARSGDDCCNGACIGPEPVDAFLLPRGEE